MRHAFRSRLSYANVMSTLAVFVALGGSSYAAVKLSNNSVKSRHIAKGQVKNSDIGKSAVTAAKVKNGSLLKRDFKAGELPAGPRGATGARGETGAQGPPGVSGLELVNGTSANNSNSSKFATATCPAGKRAIGSGGQVGGQTGTFPNEQADVVIYFLVPSDENTVPGSVTAFAAEEEATGANWTLQATAICANVS